MNFNGIPPQGPGSMIPGPEQMADMMMNPPPNMAHNPHMGHPMQPHNMGGHAMHHPQQFMDGGYGAMYPPHHQAMAPPPPQMAPAALHPGMEDSMVEQEYIHANSIQIDGGNRFGGTATHFDLNQELLWMGNAGGHVTSYYGPNLQKYTSFQVHHNLPVRQLLSINQNIFSLMKDTIKCNTKLGVSKFSISNEHYRDLQCMMLEPPTTLLLAGHQSELFKMDLNTQQHINTVDIGDTGAAILRYSSSYLCSGDSMGKIHMRDPNSLSVMHTIEAHSASLSDFDVFENRLISCGFATCRGDYAVERFIKVYDFRMMRAVTPIQVHIDPMFLRFVPRYSEKICVVSTRGEFQILEQGTNSPSNMLTYMVPTDCQRVEAFDVSSTYRALSFIDSGGLLHYFTDGKERVNFNVMSEETIFPEPENVLQPFKITDEKVPLNSVPMHYPGPDVKLLSEWPGFMNYKHYVPPEKIDPSILSTMKMQNNIGYAPNITGKRRNQVYIDPNTSNRGQVSVDPSTNRGMDDTSFTIPVRYCKNDIKYSKLGIEDFDFRHYNKTNFAGLESHIPNAYCNSMLQVLYFIEPLRTQALSHICEKEFCLTCEFGFLAHMLDEQKGKTCQATNFLRAFRNIQDVAALGLVLGDTDEVTAKTKLATLIQNLNRFLLQQIDVDFEEGLTKFKLYQTYDKIEQELNKITAEPEESESAQEESSSSSQRVETIISKLFHTNVHTVLRCRCGNEFDKESKVSVSDLIYPQSEGADAMPQEHSFASIVCQSLTGSPNMQAWCNECKKYQNHVQTRTIRNLPDIIAFNCHLENDRDINFWKTQEMIAAEKHKNFNQNSYKSSAASNVKPCRYGASCTRKDCKFWHEHDIERNAGVPKQPVFNLDDHETPGWIPLGLGARLNENGTVEMVDILDEENPTPEGLQRYDLLAVVSHVLDSKTGGNLVSCIKVSEPFHLRKEKVTCTQWYLFNDFTVTPVEKYESTYVNLEWKVPCCIYFCKRQVHKLHDLTVNNLINAEALTRESVFVNPHKNYITYTPLKEDEMPGENTVVGIDTEFVTLNPEEAELRSDGTQSMIKPSQVTVARVSCLRGSGEMQGIPFIDDYISTYDQVVDYMTQFSGINPGDLDPNMSTKHLNTLKHTYMKLRFLLDTNVIFVGHGLKKDFRVINLPWPKPNHVIDTVDIYRLPKQRMISLKFLAWYFLGEKIQSGVHDSTEDARTALKLYYIYKEMEEKEFKSKLHELYDEGRKLKWKIPEVEGPIDDDLEYGLFPSS